MPAGRERARYGSLNRFHPFLELTLLKRNLTQARKRFKYLLLPLSLAILSNRSLQRCLILLQEAAHTVELLNAPGVTARHPRGEEAPLPVEHVLERIHLRPHTCVR